jgi:uncharacterized protein (UPF0264 family)
VARLLVSVRSAREAMRAVAAGADIIDVKEPARGSLGRADTVVWKEVVHVLPPGVPLSVALGELNEWVRPHQTGLSAEAWGRISFRKLGLARAGPNWRSAWRDLRFGLDGEQGPAWIAVAYTDWRAASAPNPYAVLEVASETPSVVGVMLDTWSKSEPFRVNAAWIDWAHQARDAGLSLAIAGGQDRETLPGLAAIAPDVVGVRGAVCRGGRRQGDLDPSRVAELAKVAAALPRPQGWPTSLRAAYQLPMSNLTPCASGRFDP